MLDELYWMGMQVVCPVCHAQRFESCYTTGGRSRNHHHHGKRKVEAMKVLGDQIRETQYASR